MSIVNFRITETGPNEEAVLRLGGQAAVDLLPKNLKSQKIQFELHDVHRTIANGIRRTMNSETEVLRMVADPLKVETDDPFISDDFICNRIKMIPIDQSVSVGTIFTLDVVNRTGGPMKVYTKELKSNLRKRPFNDNNIILKLNKGRFIRITGITTKVSKNYIDGEHSAALCVVAVPIDVEPVGSPSNTSPKKYRITFETNGDIPDIKLYIYKGLHEIQRQLQIIKDSQFTQSDAPNKWTLMCANSGWTVPMMIQQILCEEFTEQCQQVTVAPVINLADRSKLMTMMSTGPPEVVFSEAVEYLIKKFNSLLASLGR
jgi:hypothetical protein